MTSKNEPIHRHTTASETDGLLDDAMPLPQPPATFSDPPRSNDEHQLLRIRQPQGAELNSMAGVPENGESSVRLHFIDIRVV